MQSSISDMQIIYDRLSCSQNVLSTYIESYFNEEMLSSSNKNFMSLEERIESCMVIERDYNQQIMSSQNPYLQQALPVIKSI